MRIDHYVAELQRHLSVAADTGDEQTRAVAARLAATLESATRVVLLDALSAAAAEMTSELSPGSVDVRLRGRDPEFVVSLPAESTYVAPAEPTPLDTDASASSRTTLRLPDAVKARVETAAAGEGLSVNSWLVRAITAGLEPARRPSTTRRTGVGDNFAGWVR